MAVWRSESKSQKHAPASTTTSQEPQFAYSKFEEVAGFYKLIEFCIIPSTSSPPPNISVNDGNYTIPSVHMLDIESPPADTTTETEQQQASKSTS